MRLPVIKYGNYRQELDNGWIIERLLLMHSEAWTIYRYEQIEEDPIHEGFDDLNIDGLSHPGKIQRYTKFWSNCSDAKENAFAIAEELLQGVE